MARTSAFEDAVERTPGLSGAYRPGLQALRRSDQEPLRCANPRRLTGSVGLDCQLARLYPDQPRWDYGIGIQGKQSSEEVLWVEVHPASAKEVAEVLHKLRWLIAWLDGSARALGAMGRQYWWVASGRVVLPAHTPQRRKLAQMGLRFAGRRLEID